MKNRGWLYDKIYGFKDYATQSSTLIGLIQQLNPQAKTLLDVACGTGKHLEHFKQHFTCTGLDLDPEQLSMAQARNPEIRFHQGDMTQFDLGQRFDAITCLFSAIGYVEGIQALNQALSSMAAQLNHGGVLLLEPWFNPGVWINGRPHATIVDEPELKIARLNTSRQEGPYSILDFHYLVATPQGVEYFSETLRLYLFTQAEYLEAFQQAGLEVEFEAQGLMGRGLYTGRKR